MNRSCAKILRAARAATKYARAHSWEAGIMLGAKFQTINGGFKPTWLPGTGDSDPVLDAVSNSWEGEWCNWDAALRDARVGYLLDFYVRNSEELVTNVYVKIVSVTEALVCDCGELPFTVKI